MSISNQWKSDIEAKIGEDVLLNPCTKSRQWFRPAVIIPKGVGGGGTSDF